jgi:hypothetical protein
VSEIGQEGVDWDRPPVGAALVDLSPALTGGVLESITDARAKRRIALRIDLPAIRRAHRWHDDVRVILVADAVRSVRALEWMFGEVDRTKYADKRELLEARRRLGRTESLGWPHFQDVNSRKPLAIDHALLLVREDGVALRIAGTQGRDFREIVIAAEALYVRRSDRVELELEDLLALAPRSDTDAGGGDAAPVTRQSGGRVARDRRRDACHASARRTVHATPT